MKQLLFFCLIICAIPSTAQQSESALHGAYYLQGVMEVGSGFQFNDDHSFEFFFSYGVLDRVARGTWKQQGDSIVLNSAVKPPKDFKLLTSKKTGNKRIIIKVNDKNPLLLRYTYVSLKCADTEYHLQGNEKGEFVFDKCPLQQISLIHEFYGERSSIFDINDPNIDSFEFSIEPWIADVEFRDVVLFIKDSALTGPHPLLKKQTYTYVK